MGIIKTIKEFFTKKDIKKNVEAKPAQNWKILRNPSTKKVEDIKYFFKSIKSLDIRKRFLITCKYLENEKFEERDKVLARYKEFTDNNDCWIVSSFDGWKMCRVNETLLSVIAKFMRQPNLRYADLEKIQDLLGKQKSFHDLCVIHDQGLFKTVNSHKPKTLHSHFYYMIFGDNFKLYSTDILIQFKRDIKKDYQEFLTLGCDLSRDPSTKFDQCHPRRDEIMGWLQLSSFNFKSFLRKIDNELKDRGEDKASLALLLE